jgi:ribonucleoside-diphosphate reductase alpha chain
MMQGTGIGYSVEDHIVAKWPKVQQQQPREMAWQPHVIEDSTEGWVDAYRHGILNWMEGFDVDFDFSHIRPSGAVLKTKGGYASGPEPFRDLLNFTREIILGAQGRQLTPFEVHRLATKAGSIVMVGGVRRAAQISLSSAENDEMKNCKQGNFWLQYPELSMANNSAVIQHDGQLAPEWIALRASGTGERGLFNPHGPIPLRRKQDYDFGTNPCGEVLLRSREFCNLSIAVARPDDTIDTLEEKVRIATLLGTIQSTLTHFPGLPPEWKKNCEEERLLGVDITGTMDCPLLQKVNHDTEELLNRLRCQAVLWNARYSGQLGINQSVAVTCNKPSGNSSQLLDSSSGIHPRYAQYYIRRLRIGRDTPLAAHLRAMAVPVFPEVGQGSLDVSPVWVFELPAQAPQGAITRDQLTAIDQLDYWKMWKTCWTEHNPSCTIYVGDGEWDDVYRWVHEHWNLIGGLSFLPKDNHIYQLAPYQEITENEFHDRSRAITWDGQPLNLWAGEQAGSTDAACGAGGWCEI